ncbi:MAG: ATP-binding protein [Sphingopyxis sp.]|nr:ATP-binding protein [Sphingopyxis sp.]MDZ3832189.1 ATP-binding protein [Sphingopyxis sp.]
MPGLDLRFERPVTIVVGENGSGKSTLLEASPPTMLIMR